MNGDDKNLLRMSHKYTKHGVVCEEKAAIRYEGGRKS
jgi:hypothetical protein